MNISHMILIIFFSSTDSDRRKVVEMNIFVDRSEAGVRPWKIVRHDGRVKIFRQLMATRTNSTKCLVVYVTMIGKTLMKPSMRRAVRTKRLFASAAFMRPKEQRRECCPARFAVSRSVRRVRKRMRRCEVRLQFLWIIKYCSTRMTNEAFANLRVGHRDFLGRNERLTERRREREIPLRTPFFLQRVLYVWNL